MLRCPSVRGAAALRSEGACSRLGPTVQPVNSAGFYLESKRQCLKTAHTETITTTSSDNVHLVYTQRVKMS